MCIFLLSGVFLPAATRDEGGCGAGWAELLATAFRTIKSAVAFSALKRTLRKDAVWFCDGALAHSALYASAAYSPGLTDLNMNRTEDRGQTSCCQTAT